MCRAVKQRESLYRRVREAKQSQQDASFVWTWLHLPVALTKAPVSRSRID